MKRRFTRKYAGFTVSEATLREEDLIPALISVLEPLVPTIARQYRAEWDASRDDAGYVLDDLFQELDERAPSGCYFGAHEGDGSLFGFWEIEPKH